MIKNQYINAQKEILKTIPVNPYELTENGISQLKTSILLSIVSLAVCMSMSLVVFQWVLSVDGMAAEGLTFMFVKLGRFWLSCWGLSTL